MLLKRKMIESLLRTLTEINPHHHTITYTKTESLIQYLLNNMGIYNLPVKIVMFQLTTRYIKFFSLKG